MSKINEPDKKITTKYHDNYKNDYICPPEFIALLLIQKGGGYGPVKP
jgi:hypothetical protein